MPHAEIRLAAVLNIGAGGRSAVNPGENGLRQDTAGEAANITTRQALPGRPGRVIQNGERGNEECHYLN